jgi:hypothetical protein
LSFRTGPAHFLNKQANLQSLIKHGDSGLGAGMTLVTALYLKLNYQRQICKKLVFRLESTFLTFTNTPLARLNHAPRFHPTFSPLERGLLECHLFNSVAPFLGKMSGYQRQMSYPALSDPPRPSLRRTARRKEGVCCSPSQWCCPAFGQNEWLPVTDSFIELYQGETQSSGLFMKVVQSAFLVLFFIGFNSLFHVLHSLCHRPVIKNGQFSRYGFHRYSGGRVVPVCAGQRHQGHGFYFPTGFGQLV